MIFNRKKLRRGTLHNDECAKKNLAYTLPTSPPPFLQHYLKTEDDKSLFRRSPLKSDPQKFWNAGSTSWNESFTEAIQR